MDSAPSRDELLAKIDTLKAAARPPKRDPNSAAVRAYVIEEDRKFQAGLSSSVSSWRDEYRAGLENEGKTWKDDVIKEWPECEHPEHANNTWLRHVPTGVLIHHWGRSEAGTLGHLANLLGQHRVITETERAAMHSPGCDCGPNCRANIPADDGI